MLSFLGLGYCIFYQLSRDFCFVSGLKLYVILPSPVPAQCLAYDNFMNRGIFTKVTMFLISIR